MDTPPQTAPAGDAPRRSPPARLLLLAALALTPQACTRPGGNPVNVNADLPDACAPSALNRPAGYTDANTGTNFSESRG